MEYKIEYQGVAKPIALILPGMGANVSGEKEGDTRYDQVAERLKAMGASVVQCSNIYDDKLWPPESEEKNARLALGKASDLAKGSISTHSSVYALGFSAGARNLAQFAHEYPLVKGLTLINPDPGFEPEAVLEGFLKFRGTLDIYAGRDDSPSRQSFAEKLCQTKSGNCINYIPEADHLFSGNEELFVQIGATVIPRSELA